MYWLGIELINVFLNYAWHTIVDPVCFVRNSVMGRIVCNYFVLKIYNGSFSYAM